MVGLLRSITVFRIGSGVRAKAAHTRLAISVDHFRNTKSSLLRQRPPTNPTASILFRPHIPLVHRQNGSRPHQDRQEVRQGHH